MIFNPKTEKYGIQLKNPKKFDKLNAGKWDMGVAGHNCYMQEKQNYRLLDFEENLIKETNEEIGLKLKMFKTRNEFLKASKKINKTAIGFIFDKFNYKTKDNNEWIGLGFILTTKTNLKFTDNEVVDFKWLTPKELKQFIRNNKNYCTPLPLVFEKAEKFRLKYLK